MGYATSADKVHAGRRHLDAMRNAVAQGTALDFNVPLHESASAYAYKLRELLVSAAEFPQAEGDKLLNAAVRVKILHAERLVRVEPKGLSSAVGGGVGGGGNTVPQRFALGPSKENEPMTPEAGVSLLLNATSGLRLYIRGEADAFERGATALGWQVSKQDDGSYLCEPPPMVDDASPFDLMEGGT